MTLRLTPVLALVFVLAACGSAGSALPAPPTSPRAAARSDDAAAVRGARPLRSWPMFGLRPSRENATNASTGVTASTVGGLKRRQVQLPGVVDSSPIVLGTTAFATTIYGRTVAVDLRSGAIRWTFTPPGYDSWVGSAQITNASPAADPSHKYVFAASPDGKVHRLSVASGREVGRGFPVTITRDATHEKLTSSFGVSGRRLIVATGGYIGDAPPYLGHVVTIDRRNGKLLGVFNSLCSNRHAIIVPRTCHSSDSAIWSRSGAVVGPGGDLLVATGNGPFDGRRDWGDSVLRLTPDARRLKGNFTPKGVSVLENTDADLGSGSPALLGHGLVLQGGKDAKLHVVALARLRSHPGPHLGRERQILPAPGGDLVFTAPAVWHHGGQATVFVTTNSATAAYRLVGGRLRASWSNRHGGTSPILAGGLLYVQDPAGGLRVYRPGTGTAVAKLDAGGGHWNSPVIIGGRIVMPEGNANLHGRSGVLDIWGG